MRTLPDGFNGAIMAVESISDAIAFLHGPGGCRVRHMVHSTAVFPREDPNEIAGYSVPYFYNYPRVPATYLDEYDYIYGASYKVLEGLPIVASKKPSLIVIVNSPGAGLIGENHEKTIRDLALDPKIIHMDESLVSMPFTTCYGHTLRAVAEKLDPIRDGPVKNTVNIIGLTILDKDWRDAKDELSKLVESMGLKVRSVPGAGASVLEIRESVNSEYSIVVCPEACAGLLEFYESHGVKTIRSGAGAPVGFDSTERWILTIAEETGMDPAPALDIIRRAKDRVFDKFIGTKYNSLRIKGLTFSVAGTASVVRPLTEWLYTYLSMAPIAVSIDPGADEVEVEFLKNFLDSVGYSSSFDQEPKEGSGVVLSEGITAYTMELNGGCRIGIPIGYSSMGLDDIIPRPVYGVQGALYILDEILHGVRGS